MFGSSGCGSPFICTRGIRYLHWTNWTLERAHVDSWSRRSFSSVQDDTERHSVRIDECGNTVLQNNLYMEHYSFGPVGYRIVHSDQLDMEQLYWVSWMCGAVFSKISSIWKSICSTSWILKSDRLERLVTYHNWTYISMWFDCLQLRFRSLKLRGNVL